MKLSQVKSGDTLIADRGFDCMKPGPHEVKTDGDGNLYIACSHGQHMLDGQVSFSDTDELVGLSKAEQKR